jgi:F-type H+-transporting ATPase subunit epsilon
VALEVHVVTPEREVWAGQATEVIAHGVDGDVGILAGHAPLLVHLAVGPLQIQEEDGSWLKAVVDGGFLHVSTEEEGASRVDVLATNAQLESEIDVDAVRRRLDELTSAAEGADDERVKTEIARAEARITLTGAH